MRDGPRRIVGLAWQARALHANGKDGGRQRFLLRLRDGTAHDRQRMTSPDVHIAHCAGSFLGAVQPDRLLEMELPTADGLLQRFMPLIMREARAYEDSDDADDAKGLLRPVRDRLAALVPVMQRDPYRPVTVAVPYKLNAEGAKLYQRFANDMRLAARAQEPSREFGECLHKMGPMWLSLALLFHLIETDGPAPAPTVPFEVARRADAIIREYLHSARRAVLRPARRRRQRPAGAFGRDRDPALPQGRDRAARRGAPLSRDAGEGAQRADQADAAVRDVRLADAARPLRAAHPRWRRTPGLGERFAEELKREEAARAALTAAIKADATRGRRKQQSRNRRAENGRTCQHRHLRTQRTATDDNGTPSCQP